MRRFRSRFVLILAVVVLSLTACSENGPSIRLTLSDKQLGWVADKIFQNECAGKVECLVHWNEGEAFPSLGIGHFIWYPRGVDAPFHESFPDLVKFMKSESVDLPAWLAELNPLDAPWPNRETFLAQQNSPHVEFLRWFLDDTQHVQAAFMFERAQASLTRILEATPEDDRMAMRERMADLTATPGGVYALIDYVNFKGEGLATTEAYNGRGWGLRQVLETMADSAGDTSLDRFRNAAADVLTRRADNAPRDIERQKWLPGWLSRLETYRESSQG